MTYISNLEYYTNNGNVPTDVNWGSYQYVNLYDIVIEKRYITRRYFKYESGIGRL